MKKMWLRNMMYVCLLLLLAFSLGGCISFTPSQVLYEDDIHEDGVGYIYGRFSTLPMKEGGVPILYNSPVDEFLEDYYFGYPKFSLVIGDNAFFYNIREDEMVQVMAVRPGTYTLDSIEYLNYEEPIEPTVVEFASYNNEIVVGENEAVYIGDFSGVLGRNYDNYVIWEVNDPENNYEKTTDELKEKYSFLGQTDISFSSHIN